MTLPPASALVWRWPALSTAPAPPFRKTNKEHAMAGVTTDGMDAEHAQSPGRRYLIRFEEDTLRQRPL
jgi:hypothetical protein